MAETYILGAGEQTALRPFNEWLAARQGRKDRPPLTAEQIDSARKAWRKAATKAAGLEEPPPTGTQPAPTPPPTPPAESRSEEVPRYLRPDPRVPAGGYREAEQAGREMEPPKPPAPPEGSGVLDVAKRFVTPAFTGLSKGVRAIERPAEQLGEYVTEKTKEPARRALRNALARGIPFGPAGVAPLKVPKPIAKKAGDVAAGAAEFAGGGIAYAPQMAALSATGVGELVPEIPYLPKVLQYIPRSYITGAVAGPLDYLFKFGAGEAPAPTAETLGKAAHETGKGFVEAETGFKVGGAAVRGLTRMLAGGPDWWEGSTNRPKTENQATPDQPTPPVRDDQDPAFVREANKEQTPPTAGKKEPAAPGLSAQNERVDKPGSGAGGTDPDDDGTQPAGKGPTSASVPPGVAPGDIREGDAVKPTPAGQGTSDQFKPRPEGPIRDYFKQLEEERRQRQEEADNAARTAEIGPRRETGAPRNLMDYYRRLRGEPAEEPAAPVSRAERQGLPRTLMEYLRNPRGYAETRAARPAGPRGPRVLPPGGPDVVARLLRQLRGEEPEAQPGPPVVPEERGWPTALIDEQRREREAEEAQRQTQVEKERQAAGQAELEQRVRNRQERETAAAGQSRLLRILGRDREQRALEALRGVERPGVEWTGPIPPRERPYEGEGWRWPEEPPKPPKAPKPPKPPVEPEAPEEVVEEVEQEEPKKPVEPEPPKPVEPEPPKPVEPKKPEHPAAVHARQMAEKGLRPDGRPLEPEAGAGLTEAERGQLRSLGYGPAIIDKMAPEEGREVIASGEKAYLGARVTPERLQHLVKFHADEMRDTQGKTRGEHRERLRRAARLLAELTSPEDAGGFVREKVGDGMVSKALDDILGDQLKRPKVAAPGRRPGRGKPEAAKPTTASVLPTEPKGEKAAIFAVRMKDGTVHADPNANFHVDVMDANDLDPDQIRDTGFIWQGKYHPGNPQWSDTGEIKSIKPPAGLPNWIKPEDVTAWKLELEQLRKDRAGELEPDPDEEVTLRGKAGTLHVEDFPNTPFRYEVVERGDLVTSHDTEGNPNPDYPEDLQQRALDRDAYQETQREIKTNMQPERLGEAPSAIEGAPVVTHLLEGNVVLGGKQRVAALQALEEGSDADETYQNWLYGHAADFGIDPTGLEGFARPTLIRRLTRRLTPEEAREFAPNTDVSPSMELSPSEKARMDARRLTPAMLEQLDVTESGNLNTEGNLPFIRSFMAQLPRTARNLLVTDNGFLNDDGLRRVQNAVLARAYSIGKELHPAIARMFESTDEKTKTIQHALLRAAPDFAVYRGAVDEGDLEMVDTMTPLLNGAATVSALRNNRMTIQDWLDQEKLGGKDPLEQAVMQAYRDNTTVPTLTDYLKDMANLLHNLPSKKAGDLFDRPATPTPLQVFHLLRDPDLVSLDTEDAERVQQAVRDLDREIRTARAQGDLPKVERLEEQKKALQKKAPC
jgi:hypothetical protein